MLTPEITGEVRARFARDTGEGSSSQAAAPDPHVPSSPFQGSSYLPAGRAQPHREGERERAPYQHTQSAPSSSAPQSRQAASSAPAKGDRVIWAKEGRLVGFMVSFDNNPNGEVFDLRCGRLIVTSEAAGNGNFLVISDESVSPMHAILRMGEDNQAQILDQLSEHGTIIKRMGKDEEERLSGDKTVIGHGDLIRFGKRNFHVCMIVV